MNRNGETLCGPVRVETLSTRLSVDQLDENYPLKLELVGSKGFLPVYAVKTLNPVNSSG